MCVKVPDRKSCSQDILTAGLTVSRSLHVTEALVRDDSVTQHQTDRQTASVSFGDSLLLFRDGY